MRYRGFWTCDIRKYSTFLSIIWGLPFFITAERERKGQGLKMEKKESSKCEWDTGVSHLIALKNIPLLCQSRWGLPFLITLDRGRKGQGLKMGKEESSKSEWDTGVSDLGTLENIPIIPFILGAHILYYFRAEIDRSGFLPLLQVQKHLQDQEQGLLPDSGAPVQAGPPVQAEPPVWAEPPVGAGAPV